MRLGRGRFMVDRSEGKLFGVCAGIANHTGLDANLVRAALVVVTLMGAWPWSVIAYGVAAFVGRRRSDRGHAGPGSLDSSRERMRSIDLRMQAIETYATSANSRLAREIEDLRRN